MKQEQNQNIEKLIEMVKDVRVCMLLTIEKNAENLSVKKVSQKKNNLASKDKDDKLKINAVKSKENDDIKFILTFD